MNAFIDTLIATIIHPLFITDDSAMIDFILIFFSTFVRGKKDLIMAIEMAHMGLLVLIAVSMNAGRIFCHVISTIIVVIFILMFSIVHMYHLCVGHPPIFVMINTIIILSDTLLFFLIIRVKIPADANI